MFLISRVNFRCLKKSVGPSHREFREFLEISGHVKESREVEEISRISGHACGLFLNESCESRAISGLGKSLWISVGLWKSVGM